MYYLVYSWISWVKAICRSFAHVLSNHYSRYCFSNFRYAGCCWGSLVNGGSSWFILTSADLTPGQDGLSNTSPVTSIPPVIFVPPGPGVVNNIVVPSKTNNIIITKKSLKVPVLFRNLTNKSLTYRWTDMTTIQTNNHPRWNKSYLYIRICK